MITDFILFSGVWLLIGIVFFIIGIVMKNNRKKKEFNCTSKTMGIVKDLVRNVSYDSDNRSSTSMWHAVFEYKIGDLTYVKESPYGTSQSKYAIGQEVEIYYNPEDPHEYYVAGEKTLKILGNVFTFLGLGLILLGLFISIAIFYNNM